MQRLSLGAWCVYILSIAPSLLPAQPTRRDSINVVLSASGAIAGGSYQGGVNWALVEFLRRANLDPDFRNRAYRTAAGAIVSSRDSVPLAAFVVSTTAGASAGNINAMFTAAQWCTAKFGESSATRVLNITPEQSLFWGAWVNTGIRELLPDTLTKSRHVKTEPAVFDRHFFSETRRQALSDYFDVQTEARPNCKVPVAITLTSVDTISYRVTSGITAAVQRMATLFAVESWPSREGWRLHIAGLGKDIVERRSLGAIILLPELYEPRMADSDRLTAAFNAAVASSSFPVAFGPVTLSYRYPYPFLPDERGRAFVDGGVFDNNPLALGLEVLNARTWDPKHLEPRRDDSVLVAYVNPGLVRGDLRASRGSSDTMTREGLGAAIQLLQGAYPAARQYELHSLGRQLQRDSLLAAANTAAIREQLKRDPTLIAYLDKLQPIVGIPTIQTAISSRSAPIYGDHLGAFAAFLGRPLREYDFYVGIYDGMEFIARWFLCSGYTRDRTTSSDARRADDRLEECVRTEHKRLVDSNVFALQGTGEDIVRALSKREASPNVEQKPLRSGWSKDQADGPHEYLLRAVFDAAQLMRPRADHKPCRAIDPLNSVVCKDGFGIALAALHDDQFAQGAARKLAQECESKASDSPRRAGACKADGDFAYMLRRPQRYFDLLAGRVLTRLADAEDSVKNNPRQPTNLKRAVKIPYLAYRSTNYGVRRGVSFNASSAVWDGRRPSRIAGSLLLGNLVPNYINAGAGMSPKKFKLGGYGATRATPITFGWMPTLYLPWRNLGLQVVAPIEQSFYISVPENRKRRLDPVFGGGLMLHRKTFLRLSSLQTSAMWVKHLLHDDTEPSDVHYMAYEVSGRWAFDKIRAGIRFAPSHGWAATAGVSDVNGLFYWLVR